MTRSERLFAGLCWYLFVFSCAEGLQKLKGEGGASGTTATITTGSGGSSSITSTASSVDPIVSSTGLECVPGTTQLCNGPGACVGAQSCAQDGTGYDECVCSEEVVSSSTSSSPSSAAVTSGGGGFVCDPLSPGAVCGVTKQCIPQSNGDPVCAPAGNGNFFDLCVDFSQCLPGMDCVNDGVNSCCMAWCRLNYNDCPSGFTCTEVLGNPSINGVVYGVCWDGYPCVL